jgi:predicted kinase
MLPVPALDHRDLPGAIQIDETRKLNVFMYSRPVVYLICGFIGAGKTTFAKKLEEKTGAVRITKDEWSVRLIGTDPTIDGYEEWDDKICELSRDVAFQIAGRGMNVIIDEGFWEKEQRVEMRRRTDAIGAKAVMYFVETPLETIRERVAGRNKNLTKDSFEISPEMLEKYLPFWQPPGEDEDYLLAAELDQDWKKVVLR